jgi:hypothetical protein
VSSLMSGTAPRKPMPGQAQGVGAPLSLRLPALVVWI